MGVPHQLLGKACEGIFEVDHPNDPNLEAQNGSPQAAISVPGTLHFRSKIDFEREILADSLAAAGFGSRRNKPSSPRFRASCPI